MNYSVKILTPGGPGVPRDTYNITAPTKTQAKKQALSKWRMTGQYMKGDWASIEPKKVKKKVVARSDIFDGMDEPHTMDVDETSRW